MTTRPQPNQPTGSIAAASSLARLPETQNWPRLPDTDAMGDRPTEPESRKEAWLHFRWFNPLWLVNIAAGVACAWQLWEMSNPQHPLGNLIWGDLTTGLPFSQSDRAGLRWGQMVLLAVPVIGCLCIWFSEQISEVESLQNWGHTGERSLYVSQSPAWLIWVVGWVMLFILPGICTQLVVRVSPGAPQAQSSRSMDLEGA